MLMRVDLPAPFSPITPWMAPLAIEKLTREFACTGPKALHISRNSTAGGIKGSVVDFKNAPDRTSRRGALLNEVEKSGLAAAGDLDLAVDDIGLGFVDFFLHVRRDQRAVVLVDHPVHAVFLQALVSHARFPGAVLHLHEGIVDRIVHVLD